MSKGGLLLGGGAGGGIAWSLAEYHANKLYHYDASSNESLHVTDTLKVEQWDDLGPGGRHLLNLTDYAAQMDYIAASEVSGCPAIRNTTASPRRYLRMDALKIPGKDLYICSPRLVTPSLPDEPYIDFRCGIMFDTASARPAAVVTPNEPHQAWLIVDTDGNAILRVDGVESGPTTTGPYYDGGEPGNFIFGCVFNIIDGGGGNSARLFEPPTFGNAGSPADNRNMNGDVSEIVGFTNAVAVYLTPP